MVQSAKRNKFASITRCHKDTISNFLFLIVSRLRFFPNHEFARDFVGPPGGVNTLYMCLERVPLESGIDGLHVNSRVTSASCLECAGGGRIGRAGRGMGEAMDMGRLWEDGDGLCDDA